jgi:hypothetical protein
MKRTALLVAPTIAVLLGTPWLKPPPPPVEIMVKADKGPEWKAGKGRKRPEIKRPVIRPEIIAPGKAQPRKKPGKSTGSPPLLPRNNGPDLPWPCWVVKAHAAGKSEAQLRAEGRAAGIKLTPKQEAQARACLKG